MADKTGWDDEGLEDKTRYFLYLEKARGGSTDTAHLGWIDVEEWTWEAVQGGRVGAGGSGAPAPRMLSVVKPLDLASIPIMQAWMKGISLGKARLEVVRSTGDVILQLNFTDVVVSYMTPS